jgi:hypothetical protein
MPDLVIFNILIPCTENATGIVPAPEKFDVWLLETVDRFGGTTVMGIASRANKGGRAARCWECGRG